VEYTQKEREAVSRLHQLLRELSPDLEKRDEAFVPGETWITTGKALYDGREIGAVLDSLLGGWLGFSKEAESFEKELAEAAERRHAVFVNSGSSANLLALAGLKDLRELKGGEVIVPALAFPTTVNPLVQLGFTPVFCDVDETMCLSAAAVKKALSAKTRGLVYLHALGNSGNIDEMAGLAESRGLFLFEDCCDAFGSRFDGALCGSFGEAASLSFYPSHGLTTGEGGAVLCDDDELARILRSLRDWGRACGCPSHLDSVEGLCGSRFAHRLGGIPYDHRYVYERIGYNLKPTEAQAAMGRVQLSRLTAFNERRRENFIHYRRELQDLVEYLRLPRVLPQAEPVFFGLPIILQNEEGDPGLRERLVRYLYRRKIAVRYPLAGDLSLQPAYRTVKYEVRGSLEKSRRFAADCLWLGIHPGISGEMIRYTAKTLRDFFAGGGSSSSRGA
jgi:CDP-4-dehydro-6-deoxyglucose reductase, E1